MSKMMQWLTTCALVVLVSVTQAQEKLVFTPQWTPQAQFVGYYVASSLGYYKDAGLDVTIKHPSPSKSCVAYLEDGESQLITLHLIMAMNLIDKGHKLVNVLQTSQQNSQMIVSHTPIKGPEGLRNMKVGHWKTGFTELLVAMDKKYNLNIQWIPFISNVNAYISGAIDAAVVMSYNEYFQLVLAGQRLKKEQLLYMRDIGYNVPEDGLYVEASYYRKHKVAVDKFVEASRKGWEWAVEHPEDALDIVMLTMRQNGVVYNSVSQKWMLRECLRSLEDKKSKKRTYSLDSQSLELANKILKEGDFIKKDITFKRITQL